MRKTMRVGVPFIVLCLWAGPAQGSWVTQDSPAPAIERDQVDDEPPAPPPDPPTAGERVSHVTAGSRVRLRFEDGRVAVGSVLKFDEQAVTLVDSESRVATFPRRSVAGLEVASGKRNFWLTGLIAGAAIGLVIGATDPVDGCAGEGCYTRAQSVGEGLVGGALLGVLVGALVKTDRWYAVPLELQARVRRPGIGARAALSVAWRF